jgi:hypothetical protein
MTVAHTIFNQLGGNRFAFMTGSKNFTNTGKGLQFRLSRNKTVANFCIIKLNGSDLYDVEFVRAGKSYKEVSTVNGVYADQLQAVFTQVTGLYTKF